MARRVFFSFHFGRDHWRAAIVRNSWLTRPSREQAGFFDAVAWERIKKQSDPYIKEWIRARMKGCTVTAVLIGSETAQRKYVRYEIQHSWDSRMGLVGIHIHRLKDRFKLTTTQGANPFDLMGLDNILTYDWVADDGYQNLGNWIERAAQRATSRKLS